MKKFFFAAVLALLSFSTLFANERPRLVVGIVIDQMRWDYLKRYADRYCNGGFKRLEREGFSFTDTHLNYIPTFTGVGHASIFTGTVPAIHGIAGNNFQKDGKHVYCCDDARQKSVGTDNSSGRKSPHLMLSSTIGDELHYATSFRAKVIAISQKDRASILPGGHTADAAYWYDGKTGNWITSTYYRDELPRWVQDYNARKRPQELLSKPWETLYPIETYAQSTPDSTRYEYAWSKQQAATMPVDLQRLAKERGLGLITSTPFGNTITFELAKDAVLGEQLGQDEIPDFLSVSLSSTDYVGHQFGPHAIETEDAYLRIDRELADFLSHLDKHVGKGKYVVFLTADHAGATNLTYLRDKGAPAGHAGMGDISKGLERVSKQLGSEKTLVKRFDNYQVYLDHAAIATAGLDKDKVIDAFVEEIEKHALVAYAFDQREVLTTPMPQVIRERAANGYNRERSGEIQIIVKPGWHDGGWQGTTHGTPWNYDTHIPLIFMGCGIKHGKSAAPHTVCDIAATVCELLDIQMPSGCIGTSAFE